ncbi:MAG: energy-dependent translational throttle protein EttA, partial [Pirellulaceae bacterium]
MNRQYIYTIERLTKRRGQKDVRTDLWLAFSPGATSGVLGSHGAGTSTLRRIMAGEDKDFDGTARLTQGFT